MEVPGNVEGECARAGTKVVSLATTVPRQSDEDMDAWWPFPGTMSPPGTQASHCCPDACLMAAKAFLCF